MLALTVGNLFTFCSRELLREYIKPIKTTPTPRDIEHLYIHRRTSLEIWGGGGHEFCPAREPLGGSGAMLPRKMLKNSLFNAIYAWSK